MKARPDTRRLLLDAASRLFTERGYDAVSTREIAEEAGVNLAAIQYHFGSKPRLFMETVHTLMKESACFRGHSEIVAKPASTRLEAAQQIVLFIHTVMSYFLQPEGPSSACRLMFREIFADPTRDREMYEALVSSVVEQFSRPMHEGLVSLLRIIAPNAPYEELSSSAASIAGQCSFYATHRPFLERIRDVSFAQPEVFAQTVAHIARFSLRALGCAEEEINAAIAQAQSSSRELQKAV